MGTASGFQWAWGAVSRAAAIEKRDPAVHEGAACRQGLPGGADKLESAPRPSCRCSLSSQVDQIADDAAWLLRHEYRTMARIAHDPIAPGRQTSSNKRQFVQPMR